MSEDVEYYRHLASTMWKTRGVRFGAAASLSFKDRFAVGVTAFLSVYMIAWSIASLAFPELFTTTLGRLLSFVSIVSSIALLTITLMEFAFGRSVRAQILQQNALSISLIMRELEMELNKADPCIENLMRLGMRYEQLNFETHINHTPQDFTRWRYSNEKSRNSIVNFVFAIRSTAYRIMTFFTAMFIYISLCITIVCLTLWATLSQ